MASNWSEFIGKTSQLKQDIQRTRAIHLNSTALREKARNVSQYYFRETRPELQILGFDIELIKALDEQAQKLLQLTQKRSQRKNYLKSLDGIERLITDVSIARELLISEREYLARTGQSSNLSNLEALIYDSLMKLIPPAALSYKQAIIDLRDRGRLSYRGVANELRETMRETLDYLAPDKDITSQGDFSFEEGLTKPTMRQKARFIFKARGLSDEARKIPEGALEIVEERVASFTRATYTRSTISTHVATERTEIMWMKNYVDAVLAELLALKL